MTLSLTINETLTWLSSMPFLMQKSFPHIHTPFSPFSPSLISLMVSVDVKHHVYSLCIVSHNSKSDIQSFVRIVMVMLVLIVLIVYRDVCNATCCCVLFKC